MHTFRFACGALAAVALTACALPRTAAANPPAASAAACTQATTACEQWVTYGAGPARSMVYATYALDRPNANVKRALIVVHGMLRNADHYFRTATTAAFLAGALDDTLVIAPHFTAGKDARQPNEVVWSEGRVNWRDGGFAVSDPKLTSFDFVDNLQRMLADKKNFPNLEQIVVTGHSAGGQFVSRYEMANRIDGKLGGIKTRYVIANPSSYAWPDANRPLPVEGANPVDAYKEAVDLGEEVNTQFKFGPFDAAKAPGYNQWPKGLENLSGYTAGMPADQLRRQLAERDAVYLLGQVDVLPLGGFDDSPTAMAQGPTRRARGEAYVKYVNEKLGGKAKAIIVPECGHNDRCVYTTREVLPVIFPD